MVELYSRISLEWGGESVSERSERAWRSGPVSLKGETVSRFRETMTQSRAHGDGGPWPINRPKEKRPRRVPAWSLEVVPITLMDVRASWPAQKKREQPDGYSLRVRTRGSY